jgi:hypothetical protein
MGKNSHITSMLGAVLAAIPMQRSSTVKISTIWLQTAKHE